jgi:plasmid stability protein
MSAVVIRDLPPALHQRLKTEAVRHHRSMNREIIAILEKELDGLAPVAVRRPVVPSKPLSAAWIRETTREMRDGR